MIKLPKYFFGVFALLLISLFLFSFTQVDLGLTLSRASYLTQVQQFFQHIGYFNRPLAAFLYIAIIIGLFFCFFYLLKNYKRLSRRVVWSLVIMTTIILAFSYNAFSYDIFNYIFDAKIITGYGLNPYGHKALDFPTDPMLSFMHWTHREYPYGPAWLALTVPISYIGLQVFTLTFFLFKVLMALSFLGTVYFIEKIMRKIQPERATQAIIFFALNPFIFIESLVSGHNDIVMMFFCMMGIYLLAVKRFYWGILLILISAAIKYVTVLLIPLVFLLTIASNKKVKIEWDIVFQIFVFVLCFGIGAATLRTHFQPWYLLFIFPILSLLVEKKHYLYPSIILSIGALTMYVPYLYLGNDSYSITNLLPIIQLSFLGLAITTGIILLLKQKRAS